MEKGDVRSGGSSRLRQTGGESDGVLDKSSKKEKLRRLSSVGKISEMDQLFHSNSARVKLPKKFFDRCGSINHASVPRKVRSAMKKRQHEYPKICPAAVSLVLQDSRNGFGQVELWSKGYSKKLKTAAEEHKKSKTTPRGSVITKDEEEVAEALFALAQTFPSADHGEPSEAEPSFLPGSLVLQESMHTECLHEADNTTDVSSGRKSRKRCSVHVYICRLITVLQTTDSKGLQQGACVNVRSDMNPDEIMNENQISKEAENVHTRLLQEQQRTLDVVSLVAPGGGCEAEGNVGGLPEPMTEAALMQLHDRTGMHLTNRYSAGLDGHISAATEPVIFTSYFTRGKECFATVH